MSESIDKAFSDLMKEVVIPGSCTVCGTCIAVCPYNALILREESFQRLELRELEVTDDLYRSIEDLCEQCGFCYYNCPEIMFNLEKTEEDSFGAVSKSELGHFSKAYMAQSTDKTFLENAQCGGVATSLLQYMLENNKVDAVVAVTAAEYPGWRPQPTVITEPQNLWRTQKSKYTPAATVIGVFSALYGWGRSKSAVVATPCQVHGIWTTRKGPKEYSKIFNSLRLIIGLFCFGTYSYNDLFGKFLAEQHGIATSSINKIDLDSKKMRVYVEDKLRLEVHRRQVRRFLRKACRSCRDFTNRLADLSLGAVGTPEKWTTVLIRTESGGKIFEDALNGGYLEAEPLGEGALEKIEEVARLKREGVPWPM